MDIAAELAKLVVLLVLVIVVPFLFMLIFDLGVHLGELFRRGRS